MSTMLLRDLTRNSLGHRVKLEEPAQRTEPASELIGTLISVTHTHDRDTEFEVEVVGHILTFNRPCNTEIEFVDADD